MGDIYRKRGDTYPVKLTVVNDAGAAQDITGKTFVLTASTIENPEDGSTQLFQLTGSITDAAAGEVEFPMIPTQADNTGDLFFDVEMTTTATGEIRTVVKGSLVMQQDITKSDESFEWTPPTAPSDGDAFPVDGSVGAWAFFTSSEGNAAPAPTYQTRDTRRVIRFDQTMTSTWAPDNYGLHRGDDAPRGLFPMPGWEWEITFYQNLARITLAVKDASYISGVYPTLDTRSGSVVIQEYGGLYLADGSFVDFTGFTPFDPTGWPVAGWYVLGCRIAADGSPWMMIKPEAEADNWKLMHPTALWPSRLSPLYGPELGEYLVYPDNPASVVDIWKYEWRRL